MFMKPRRILGVASGLGAATVVVVTALFFLCPEGSAERVTAAGDLKRGSTDAGSAGCPLPPVAGENQEGTMATPQGKRPIPPMDGGFLDRELETATFAMG